MLSKYVGYMFSRVLHFDDRWTCFPLSSRYSANSQLHSASLRRFVDLLAIVVRARCITALYGIAQSLHEYFNHKCLRAKRQNWYTFVTAFIMMFYICVYSSDIVVNTIPISTILRFVKEKYSDNSVLQGLLILFALPSVFIYVGIFYPLTTMLLE